MSEAKTWADELEFALSDEMFPAGSTLQMNPDVIRDGARIMRQLEAALTLIGDVADDRDGFTGDAEKLGELVDEIHGYARNPQSAVDALLAKGSKG